MILHFSVLQESVMIKQVSLATAVKKKHLNGFKEMKCKGSKTKLEARSILIQGKSDLKQAIIKEIDENTLLYEFRQRDQEWKNWVICFMQC